MSAGKVPGHSLGELVSIRWRFHRIAPLKASPRMHSATGPKRGANARAQQEVVGAPGARPAHLAMLVLCRCIQV